MENEKLPPCVIMAGGLGSRLGAITKNKPKPAIKIKGKPFIYYTIDWLTKNGFSEFIFLLSYKSEILEDLIVSYSKEKNIRCTFYLDEKRSGTFNAIYNIRNFLREDFFYTNADEISDVNIQSMYSKFLDEGLSVISLLKRDGNGDLNLEKGFIKEKLNSNYGTHIELGCKFVNKNIFELVDTKYEKFEDFLYLDLINKTNIGYFISKTLPIRIDKASDIKLTNEYLTKKQ